MKNNSYKRDYPEDKFARKYYCTHARLGQLRNDKKHILNSPLNLTYISDIANKKISTQAPDHYLKQLYSGAITDHCIPAKPNNSALKSEQEKFLKARYALIKEALEKHIEELKNKF